MISTSLHDIQRLIDYAVDAGIQAYERGRDPDGDMIKRGEAERLISRRGFQPVMLRKWTEAGLLVPIKKGDGQNSPKWYSLADVKKVMATMKLKQMCNR
jgi:hypothetical protein